MGLSVCDKKFVRENKLTVEVARILSYNIDAKLYQTNSIGKNLRNNYFHT